MQQILAFVHGRYAQALEAAAHAEPMLGAAMAMPIEATYHFYHALTLAALYPAASTAQQVVKQAKLMGVLYLENNLASGVFTTKRLAMLELLTAQAAISLDHARLYADLIQENNDRRKAEEALRASEERWSMLAWA